MGSARLEGGPAPAYEHGTVNDALAAAARSDKGVTFLDLKENATYLPWGDVHERAQRTAAYLASQGASPGDRILISAATSRDVLDALFGAMLAGAVPVPVAPAARTQSGKGYADRAQQLTEALGCRLVVADEASSDLLKRGGFSTTAPLLRLEGLADKTSETLSREVRPDDIALLQLSSGSVGAPKPVAIAHRHVTQHCEILARGMPGVETTVSWLPLYHDMGLTGMLFQSICKRQNLVLCRPEHFVMRPALWLRAMSRYRSEFCSVPNFAYAMCVTRVSDADMEGADLGRWRHGLNGAEPIHAESFRKFGERFARWGLNPKSLRPTYGLAEATLAVTISPEGTGIRSFGIDPDRLARTGEVVGGKRELCSVGAPYPGVTVEIRDPDGNPVPERTAGAVWIQSPTNMLGYFRNDEATARVLKDGWLDSGDLGFVADGELYLVGRAKDIVVIRGGNHSPEEFEHCLVDLEGMRQGGAVAAGTVPEGATGEELFMLVEAAPGADKDELVKRIRAIVLEQTGIRPHTVALVPRGSLPRTTSGKLRRAEALRLFLAGQLTREKKGDGA